MIIFASIKDIHTDSLTILLLIRLQLTWQEAPHLIGAFQIWELVDGVHNVPISDPKQPIHQVHIAQVVEEGVWGEHSHASYLHLTLCGRDTC